MQIKTQADLMQALRLLAKYKKYCELSDITPTKEGFNVWMINQA